MYVTTAEYFDVKEEEMFSENKKTSVEVIYPGVAL